MTTTTRLDSNDDTSTSFNCEVSPVDDINLSSCNIPKNDTFSYEHTFIQALFARACKDTATCRRVSIGNVPSADYRVELAPDLYATIELLPIPEENKYLIIPSHPNLDIKVIKADGSTQKIGKSEIVKNDTWLEVGNVKVFLPKLRKPSDSNHPLVKNTDLLFEADRLVHVISELIDSMSLDKPLSDKELVECIGKLNVSLIHRVHEAASKIKKDLIEAILSAEELNGKEEELIENFLIHHLGADSVLKGWIKDQNFKNMEVKIHLIHMYAKCIKELLELFIPSDLQNHSSRGKIKVYPNKFYENITHLGKNKYNHIDRLNSLDLSPKHAFKVRGTYFSCTDFFEMHGNRVGTFSIVSTKRSERVLRLFYLSNSHCCFRLLPAVNHHGFLPKYDKAGNEVILAPPAEVQMNFAKILKHHPVHRNVSESVFERGIPENHEHDDWIKYTDQTIQYPAKKSVGEVIDLITPPTGSHYWREPEDIKTIHSGEAPNISDFRGKYSLYSDFLGKVRCYIFRSYNQEVEYIISRTRDNDIWFSSVTSLRGPLNNFGVPKIAVDGHELTTSLYEYDSQVDYRFAGESHPDKPIYCKVQDYHSRIDYLNQFRRKYIR